VLILVIQNDYKAMMQTIEVKMQEFFEQQSKDKTPEIDDRNKNSNKNYEEPLTVSVPEETKTPENKVFVPFAYISSIMENSPAEEAGLKAGDGILRFDIVEIGKYGDPLIKVSEIVRAKKDNEIEIEVARKNEEERLEFKKLKLIPHVWCGQGLLGCKLVLENKK
jgi:26S proteasome non-ATPase regulatory subunit 9